MNLIKHHKKNMDNLLYDYECADPFCTKCQAILTMQKGYDESVEYWVCRGCGMLLINPDYPGHDEHEIVWICDKCSSVLNSQQGFERDTSMFRCRECGYDNVLDSSSIYDSEEEFQSDLNNPTRGMTEADLFKYACYEEAQRISSGHEAYLVREIDTNKLFVKKVLTSYDLSIFYYLKDHPVILMPKIIELLPGREHLVVIEEYIEGETLQQRLDKGVLFDTAETIRIASDICQSLMELHSDPFTIIHRDIKPSNIIIDSDGRARLLDINAAKWFKREDTVDTVLMGTRNYAAPEQYGFAASTPVTDIYSLGVLMNVMLEGFIPREKAASGPLSDIIKVCTRLEPEQRYKSAGALRTALLQIM